MPPLVFTRTLLASKAERTIIIAILIAPGVRALVVKLVDSVQGFCVLDLSLFTIKSLAAKKAT